MKWYLSSAHGGRKSAVARKPYNPILGEVFRCHWKLPPSPEKREEVPDIPVPWCTQDDLVFISEQVKSSFKITSKHNKNSDATANVHMITYAHHSPDSKELIEQILHILFYTFLNFEGIPPPSHQWILC